ncbi:MAG: TonB-dependent receptor, partial [Acidobacteriota bacterium]
YFVSFERNNDRESANQYVTVPTAAIKSGNMTGSNNPIYDPATGDSTGAGRTPLPGQIVPAARISKITRTLSDKTPLPNVPGDALTQNYFASAPYIFDRNRLDAKVNWNAGKLTMFGRLGFLRYNMDNPPVFGEMGGSETSSAGGNPGHGWGDTYTIVVAGNYMLTNRFIVDAYFGWTTLGTNVDTPGVEEQQGLKLGIPGTNGPARYQGGWPKFSVSNYSDLGTPGAYLPYYRSDPSKNYVTNFNWVKGTHDLRFGVDVSYQAMNHIQAEGGSGIGAGMGGFTFTGGPTTVRGGPTANQYNSYATFLLGLPTSMGKNVITSKDDKVTTRAWQYSSYVRDRWNVTPKLTLSVGARWEYYPVPTRADTGLGFYDFSNNTVRVCGYGSVPAGCGVDVGKFRLLPRVGLAYRASPTFVIRAGYGITNDPWSLARGFRTNFPAMLSLDYSGENSYQPFGRIENGIPAPVLPDMANGVVAIPKTYAANSLPQKFKRGYIQSWNLTLQKELRYGFTAQAGYVATRSVDTMGPLDLNAGQIPGAGNAGRSLYAKFGRTTTSQMIMPIATNMYDSLQTKLERRFAQGLQIGASYTWSKAIGWSQDSGSPWVQALSYFRLNKRVLGFDRTHNLQLSGIWELPFGAKKRFVSTNRAASAVLGGWRINTLASFMGGTPFSVSSSGTSLDMPGSSQVADL